MHTQTLECLLTASMILADGNREVLKKWTLTLDRSALGWDVIGRWLVEPDWQHVPDQQGTTAPWSKSGSNNDKHAEGVVAGANAIREAVSNHRQINAFFLICSGVVYAKLEAGPKQTTKRVEEKRQNHVIKLLEASKRPCMLCCCCWEDPQPRVRRV